MIYVIGEAKSVANELGMQDEAAVQTASCFSMGRSSFIALYKGVYH